MSQPESQRIYRQFTSEERSRWEKARDEALALRPQLAEKGRRLREASKEATFSGALRTAIHLHRKPLPVIAAEACVPLAELDEFLTGDRTLRSDVVDRLVLVLGMRFPPEPITSPLKITPPELNAAPIIEPGSWQPPSAPASQ